MTQHRCSCLEFDKDKGDVCANCRFGFCPGCTYPNKLDCRRHAPVQTSSVDWNDKTTVHWHTTYPEVYRTHWCGDFEPVRRDETPTGATSDTD